MRSPKIVPLYLACINRIYMFESSKTHHLFEARLTAQMAEWYRASVS